MQTDRTVTEPAAPRYVFVLEPHAYTRAYLVRLLIEADYEVADFDSLSELLSRLAERRPDGIVADASPPEALGLKLLSVTAAGDRPPVVLIAYDPDLTDAVHAMRAGAADYAEKPLPGSVLLFKLRRAMDAP
ncbi:LuxR family two component transcriptional regulator [Salinisphaera sp. PC39]|uniref:response regulator n=1 Tax=Salinisphaera sp. PC39 TaxID=1304156 RepID=UPI003340D194